MPRYTPLPSVSIDPRTEAELVQQAAQVVYDASNRTLNDFSAGNPLAALLEGQAFAQGELLFLANQLPDKILIEWIGPFLGAMRRLGTPAVAQLTVSISPRDRATIIPRGTTFTTNPQITFGQSYEFISYTDLTIPAGETQGTLSVYSRYVGNLYNVPANSITGSSGTGNVIASVTNPKPAVGGSDVETFQQVQERFFTLIRRKNPVSETDWQDFFVDLYGVGTSTSVMPSRSSKIAYSYETDYAKPNGQVSFFVLAPGGVELDGEQLKIGQNAVNMAVPIENQGHLFPITLSEVQYNLTLEVNPNGTYGNNFRQSSLNFRNIVFSSLIPGAIFQTSVNPTPNDIDSAFYSFMPSDLRYVDPHIAGSAAYNTPNGLSKEYATYTKIKDFTTSSTLLNENDLIVVNQNVPTFYPVTSNFTPYSIDKFDQTVYGNLSLKQIQNLTAGAYKLGDIVYYDGAADPSEEGLHVVLENLTVLSGADILTAFVSGKISPVKTYSPFSSATVGNTYQYSSGGTIDPEIVQYDYKDGDFIPAYPDTVPLENRPGALAWLVTNNFILEPSTNDVTGAQTEFKIGSPVTPSTLFPGNTYSAGAWVSTPQVGSGPNQTIDQNFYYIDVKKGAVQKYAYVVSEFTYNPDNQTVSNFFDSLVDQGIIKEINLFDGDKGLPIYKYSPRFKAGQYLEYRDSSNGTPGYYIATKFFTPDSTNIQDLLDSGVVLGLTPSPELKSQFDTEIKGGFSGQIGKLQIDFPGSGYVNGTYYNVPLIGGDGDFGTANVTVSGGQVTYVEPAERGQSYRINDVLFIDNSDLGGSGTGLTLSVSGITQQNSNPLSTPVRMFTFFKGDHTFFRTGNTIKSFTATEAVTPLFNFEVYYKNKVFVDTDMSKETAYEQSIPYYNPSYAEYAEDTVLDRSGKNFYRTMRAFTPQSTITNWSGVQRENSARYEEYAGNLLRYVVQYVNEEPILPQYGNETSAIRLGNCQITLIPKNYAQTKEQNLVYVWENTQTYQEAPELSWYTGTQFSYKPPDYKSGTLSL